MKENRLIKVAGTNDHGPYAYNQRNGLWVSYDDETSARQKASYVLKNGYGGAAIWTLDFDDFRNLCCKGPNPILTSVSRTLQGQTKHIGKRGSCQKTPPVVTPPPPEFDIWDNGFQGYA